MIWNLDCPVGLSQKDICVHFIEGNWAKFGPSAERKKKKKKKTNELRNVLELVDRKLSFISNSRKEGNVLFNDALNTFYLRLYGVGHNVNYHSDSKIGNLLSPHGLLFPINSKVFFICNISQTG